MRLSGDIFKGTPVHIWSVLVLDDFTIVSGDNSGRLQFWDGTNGSLVKTILQHASAIYCICASPDQSQVFASGVDSKVVCVGSLPASNSSISPADREWVYSSALRSHSHDVTTLSIVSSKESPVLLSGMRVNRLSCVSVFVSCIYVCLCVCLYVCLYDTCRRWSGLQNVCVFNYQLFY